MTRTSLPRIEPEPYGFLYLGLQVDQPQKVPFYRQTQSRRRATTGLLRAAQDLAQRADIVSARVLRTHLVPPLPGAPGHDFVMLIRTPDIDDLDAVRSCDQVKRLDGREVLVGSNAARIGETEADENAVFLLNHFVAFGEADPVGAWASLTDWYTSKIGVDNSTALRSLEDTSQFALVNYARLPSSPPRFLFNQILRPSFYRVVRGTLKRNHMRALPGFYKMIH